MVVDSSLISKYFPQLSAQQEQRFQQLGTLYEELNQKINVISRKDIDMLYLHHVLHSLSIAKFLSFADGTQVVDVGTGGGFPGIPLAILFPESNFYMIDGRSKKITVVKEVIEALGLENAAANAQRSEELKAKFDFVLARAVTRLDKLIPQTFHLISQGGFNAIPNGLLALKGGDLTAELKATPKRFSVEQRAISDYFEEEYFAEKQLLYLQK